jgi:hypothetical protein
MELAKITLAFIFNFLSSINPYKTIEERIKQLENAVSACKKAIEKAEKENNLSAYKNALKDLSGTEKELENAKKELESKETLTRNDIIQLSVLVACLYGIDYKQEDIIKLGASSTGQFGYYRRSIKNLKKLGFTLVSPELKKALENAKN